jgi:HAE1 family hydrophobic/amphiphilic exporter-1
MKLPLQLKTQRQYPHGTLFGETGEFTIDVDGQLNQASYYDSIIIKNETGNIVRIRDVGKALDSTNDDKEYLGIFFRLDKACVVLGFCSARRQLHESHCRYQSRPSQIESSLPKSVSLHRVFDKGLFIEEAVHDVELTLCVAFLLVVFVIFFYWASR